MISRSEWLARWLMLGMVLGFLLAILLARWFWPSSTAVEIHARMPEVGGWSPADFEAIAGEPLHLRMVSDDALHGFAIGQSDLPAIDLQPGKWVETTLTFDLPGKYTYYCTRWCGLNHWRMRGTIEVKPRPGSSASQPPETKPGEAPLYVRLGLDIDIPHPAQVVPQSAPSAQQGVLLGVSLPEVYLKPDYYLTHSPAEIWQALRVDAVSSGLTDQEVWNLVALTWRANTTPERLANGHKLYVENCAACHGEDGAGKGVFAAQAASEPSTDEHTLMSEGHMLKTPADFRDPGSMLGASPALLEGKLIRGGMGTGMPYWGPIFTDEQVRALIDYLWTFQYQTD